MDINRFANKDITDGDILSFHFFVCLDIGWFSD